MATKAMTNTITNTGHDIYDALVRYTQKNRYNLENSNSKTCLCLNCHQDININELEYDDDTAFCNLCDNASIICYKDRLDPIFDNLNQYELVITFQNKLEGTPEEILDIIYPNKDEYEDEYEEHLEEDKNLEKFIEEEQEICDCYRPWNQCGGRCYAR